jgi:endogenous inhibitor of DNA gyrase (YacG/DUF329 family)
MHDAGCTMSDRKLRCPICKKEALWKDNPFRPFCSERCKLIDLGKWASEDYRIADKGEGPSDGDRDKKNNEKM